MNKYDAGKTHRRLSNTRRTEDRRKISDAFGSEEWLDNIKYHYWAWPKLDRREGIRRSNERRAPDRSLQPALELRRTEKRTSEMLLTQEERQMINYLFLNEDDAQVAS